MLRERYPHDVLDDLLSPPGTWSPVPPAADRAAWEAMLAPQTKKQFGRHLVHTAEGWLERDWPILAASLAMRFEQTGDRRAWEEVYFGQRRHRLAVQVLAECIEGKGRFLQDVVDGLWAICEESSWCLPAHFHLPVLPRQAVQRLPRQDRELVDICAAETAMLLAESCHLLGPALDDISPVIRQRVRREVTTRLVEPVVAHDDWFWGRGRHNWSTWIAANTLGAGSYLLADPVLDRELVWTLMGLVDRFLARYGDDGGCDEGPMYWNVAGGMVLQFLECLLDRSGGRIDVYADPKIRAIGHYMVTAHLSGSFYTNFADARPRVKVNPERLWRYGQRCGDRELTNLALLAMRGYEPDAPVAEADTGIFGEDLQALLRQLWWLDVEARPAPLARDRHAWLPSVEVLVAREEDWDEMGLVLAAKAGHNTESHNHLDVGQVIVLLDGRPALVDVGTGRYSGKNFSPERYDIWYIGAGSHGAPIINGHGQQAGPGFGHLAERTAGSGFSEEIWYAATDVRCTGDETRSELAMDMAPCYANEAGILRARRTVSLTRGRDPAIDLVDEIAVAEGPLAVDLTLVSPLPVTNPMAGVIHLDCGERLLELRFPEDMDAVLDEKVLEDEQLREAWGDMLTLIRLRLEVDQAAATYEIRLRAITR